MAEGHAPDTEFIVTTLCESQNPRHMRFKSKFTKKNVRDALIALEYADDEGNYKYSERLFETYNHLGKIADKIIETFPEESKSKKKRRRRRKRGNKSVKGGLRRN